MDFTLNCLSRYQYFVLTKKEASPWELKKMCCLRFCVISICVNSARLSACCDKAATKETERAKKLREEG